MKPLRLLLGAAFLAAGIGKLVLDDWRLGWAEVGAPLGEVGIRVGPLAEIATGLWLLSGRLPRAAAALAALMMLVAIGAHLSRGFSVSLAFAGAVACFAGSLVLLFSARKSP